MDIPKEVVVALIGAIPALLAPLVNSLLQRRGFAQSAKELEAVEKRIQITERLLTLEKYLSEDKRKLLRAELAAVAQDLVAERVREHAAGGTEVEGLPFLRRALLIYAQPTMRASVYRGFFWFFLFFGILGGVSASFVSLQSGDTEWPFAVIGGLFYVVIGLFFRSAALRQQKRAQASAAAASSNDSGS